MGIMASERGGQVFATDERFVVNNNLLWRTALTSVYQILHRQRDHDCSGRTFKFSYGIHDASCKKYMHPKVNSLSPLKQYGLTTIPMQVSNR